MALAILELVDFNRSAARFHIDTGTNRYYQLKVGRKVQNRSEVDWIDEITYTSPVKENPASANLFNSGGEIAIPADTFGNGSTYVQLFSYKTPQGKSPAFSEVIMAPVGAGGRLPEGFMPALSLSAAMTAPAPIQNRPAAFQSPRRIPCETASERYSQAASLEDLLSGVIKVAGPIVLKLLGSAVGGGGGNGAVNGSSNNNAAGGSQATPGVGATDITSLLATILKSLLGSQTGVSQSLSLLDGPASASNRFITGPKGEPARFGARGGSYSQPMIFGIDDALLGTLASSVLGPFIQVLPQLMNAANQQRLQMKQADNKLMTDLQAPVNQRLLLLQIQNAQRQAEIENDFHQSEQLEQLGEILQQLPEGTPAAALLPVLLATAAPAPAQTINLPPAPVAAPYPTSAPPPAPKPTVAGTKSLSMSNASFAFRALPMAVDASDGSLSSRAVVDFVTAAALPWNGQNKLLFNRAQQMQLKVRLVVAEPAPKNPLPKAIFKIVFKNGATQQVYLEKTFKQKDVLPNSPAVLAFYVDELARIPANEPVVVLAEMRWLVGTPARERRALGSTEIVLVNRYALKERGPAVGTEKELVAMDKFRSFMNKVWDSPVLDAARQGPKKYLWELDVNARYSILLSPDHSSNGVMETKILRTVPDPAMLNEKTEGRMKGGIELSISELNKLLTLWPGETPLDADHLEALATPDFAERAAGEFVYRLKMKGPAAERGMIWVAPVVKMFDCTLSAIDAYDQSGQVTGLKEQHVHFPLPVAVRVIGLKSE